MIILIMKCFFRWIFEREMIYTEDKPFFLFFDKAAASIKEPCDSEWKNSVRKKKQVKVTPEWFAGSNSVVGDSKREKEIIEFR